MITLEEYLKAERQFDLRAYKRGWQIHASIYGAVIIGLVISNVLLATSPTKRSLGSPSPSCAGAPG
jgi:hypothetical protein